MHLSDLLNKFSWQSARLDDGTLAIMILVWLVVLGTALSSIFSQRFTPKQRLCWIVLVVAVPLVGLLAYLPFSAADPRFRLNWLKKKT